MPTYYDANAPGNDVWDKMVPLGAMWGNDPEADSAKSPPPVLHENWINLAAPAYAKMTLGWGGAAVGTERRRAERRDHRFKDRAENS